MIHFFMRHDRLYKIVYSFGFWLSLCQKSEGWDGHYKKVVTYFLFLDMTIVLSLVKWTFLYRYVMNSYYVEFTRYAYFYRYI